MVRETRHLWVGNLPHTIREERILDHFKRYGKVQSVKILPKKEDDSGGACATVAFIDIKSAAKAHNADNKIEDRTLKTDYYEPPASSTASSAIYIHERDDALVRNPTAPYSTPRTPRYGLSEERNYERPGHYYNDRESYLRRSLGMGYHDEDNYQGRAKSRDRYSRSNSGTTYTEGTERNQNHFRSHNTRQHFEQQRYPVGEQYNDEREPAGTTPRLNRRTNNSAATPVVASVASPTPTRSESRPRRAKRRSPSRTPSGSRSNSGSRSRSRSSSGSRSSSSSSKLRSTSSDSSGRSRSPSKSRSPAASYGSQSNTKGSRLDRPLSAIANPSSTVCYLPSAVNTSAINCTSNNTQGPTPTQGCPLDSLQNNCDKEEKRPLGICVRNLPVRSTDTSLKDGLFHEYKKHGKVTMVKVIGQGTDRYAVVCFKKPEDVDKALEVSKDKLFFGCKIEVTAHEGLDAEDNEFRPLEAELDEFHPKATRTLFIGNLEKDITTAELRKHFEQFGEIIEIDIKKQGSATSYAFIQYSDIASVVKAMRKLDGENLGANRIKLGFGKSMPTNCVWLDGIVDSVSDKFLTRHFNRFGNVAYTAVDREKGHALIFYDSVEFAQIAVSEMRGRILQGKKLQVDFASRECQQSFFEKLEMTGQMVPGDGTRPWERRERRGGGGGGGPEFEVIRNDDRETRVGFENRAYQRYEGTPRANRGNFRGNQRTGFPGRGRGQNFSGRYEVYHDEFGERRHRYNSRDESGNEATLFDGKIERIKYTDTADCPTRKRNKLRNSISDQESHHSQSPPRSRHQSRSTSPVSKERKSLKDRLHHRIKSPSSHNSSLVNSPCRDTILDELETNSEYRDSRLKSSDIKMDDLMADLSYTSPRSSSEKEGSEKMLSKSECDSFRSRSSLDAESADESGINSDQLGQIERKKRLLATSVKGGKDSKSSSEKNKPKNSIKLSKLNCLSEATVEELKSELESVNVQYECAKEKSQNSDCANSEMKYLKKKQVQILHLLDQLHESVNSSDNDCSIDGERLSRKKHRSSSCIETNNICDSDISKTHTKDECGSKVCKSGVKDPAILAKLKKSDSVDGNCISLSLDSFIFRKHLDPRKGFDQHSVSLATVNSLQKCRRISVDNDTCLPNSHGTSESFLCVPSSIATDVAWKKHGNSLSDVNFSENETDSSITLSHFKIKEENLDDLLNKKSHLSNSHSIDLPKSVLSLRSSFSEGVSGHEIKRERDISPLSLPLPKFAASLRSPKSSPSILTSPKSTSAHSPRAGHSPSYSCSKSIRIPDLLHDIPIEKKSKDIVPEEKINGANISPMDTESLFEPQINDILESMPSVEPIQSPKCNYDKIKDCISSSESEFSPSSSPNRPSIEDRIKALDEKYNVWSGSARTVSATIADVTPVPDLTPKCTIKRSRFSFLTETRKEPSEIVKSLLAHSTIFDQDSKRLQHIDEKYEPLNVKMDLSPKVKPTFRTKAAAKEFSTPIASTIQNFNPSLLIKTPATVMVAQGIISPPATPQSVASSILSPVTPPVSQYTQLPPSVFTPCSPHSTSFGIPTTVLKSADSLTSPLEKDINDQLLKSPQVFNAMKVKVDPDFHANSAVLATSLKSSPLTCPSETPSHGSVVTSLALKKEPASPTEAVTENVCNEVSSVKKEVINSINIPPKEENNIILVTKDPSHYNSIDQDKKEFCDSKDPRLSFSDEVGHWRESGCKEEMKTRTDSSAKSYTSSDVTENVSVPAGKKRVSSVDSNESDSSKSLNPGDISIKLPHESSREGHENNWPKQEKLSEPEPKKPKLSKSAQDRSLSPPMHQVSKKSDRKERSIKTEKSKSSTKSVLTNKPEKSRQEMKCNNRNDYKDKSKSEYRSSKEEKRSKSRESKDSSNKSETRGKPRERRNSEKDNKNSSSNKSSSKPKKDAKESSKNEKSGEKKQSEKKSSRSKSNEFDWSAWMDDEPVYFSMYDKVKARSSKSQTLKHQTTNDLESVRQKFSKLKQSRAKREEKSKSIDQDSDKESDSSHHSSESESETKPAKMRQQRKRKLVIESSSEDDVPHREVNSHPSKIEKHYQSDSATDSDFDYNVSHRQATNKSRKKKTELLDSDSSDSDSNFPPKSQTGRKKSVSSRSKGRIEKSKKVIKSEDDVSDLDMSKNQKSKEKEKSKKIKKEIKVELEIMDCDAPKKSDESKNTKKKTKDSKSESDLSPVQKKFKSEHASKEKSVQTKDKKADSCNEKVQSSEETEKHKPYSKKRKKSKKMSRNKDKRNSEKVSQHRKQPEESDTKSSLPVLLSPKPSSPLPDKQLSPPCLQAGVMSDNDFKSDFSDFDFENAQNEEVDTSRDMWKHLDTKSDTNSEKSSKNKKENSSKSETVIHSPEQDSSFPSFFDKLSDITDSETGREITDFLPDILPEASKSISFSSRKDKDFISISPHKTKHEKDEDQSSSKQENSKYSNAYSSPSKEERRRKKSKKQCKERKKKSKEDSYVEKDDIVDSAPSPKPLIFESVVRDENSRLSDIRLDEDIAEEARRLEQELLAASEETSTFGDDGPAKREEKLLERRFEEEAAKETRRLEAELLSTGRDSWHMKEKVYDSVPNPGDLCDNKLTSELDPITGKEENLFATLDLHSSVGESSQNDADVFLSGHSESDPYKIDDKDVTNEIEDQRKIEDDLAVSALLQEMHCGEISAPELTKEADYLDMEAHPDETMNYLLPDDGENSLHIADSSPDGQGNDSQDPKLESDVLSPSSNSEPPPALEISTVEDSIMMKTSNEHQTSENLKIDSSVNQIQSKTPCYEFHEESSLEMCESKPPVIDIPIIQVNMEPLGTPVSPKPELTNISKKKQNDKPFRIPSKPGAANNEETDDDCSNDLTENQLAHFEDITNDTADSKDDDNPPVLLPVESPPNLLPATDSKDQMEPLDKVAMDDNQCLDRIIGKAPSTGDSIFGSEVTDLDKQIGEIITELKKQKNYENDEFQMPGTHDMSDLPEHSITDPLGLNNSSNVFDHPKVEEHLQSQDFDPTEILKPSEKQVSSTHQSSLSISYTDESSSNNNNKFEIPEISNSCVIEPSMLNYSEILNSNCETNIIQTTQKMHNDAITISITEKSSAPNIEQFEENRDMNVSDGNPTSSDSFLLELFGPKNDENFKIQPAVSCDTDKNEADVDNHSQEKTEQSETDLSAHAFGLQHEIKPLFEIPEINEQNEATEFNQEIFETPSDPAKESQIPCLLSFSFSESSSKTTDKVDDNDAVNTDSNVLENEKTSEVLSKSDNDDAVSSRLVQSESIQNVEPLIDNKHEDFKEENLNIQESLERKARPADTESVCSDTTDITNPEIKVEIENNQLTSSEEQVQEDICPVEEIKNNIKPKTERPRRGRRPKTRRYVESATQKQELSSSTPNKPVNMRITRRGGGCRNTERTRRSLRSDTSELHNESSENKQAAVEEIVLSEPDDSKKDDEITELSGNATTMKAENLGSHSAAELKLPDKPVKIEEPRKRRGRRKKNSGDHANQLSDKTDHKSNEHEPSKSAKNRSKENRLILSLSEREQNSAKENNTNEIDVYEFIEEDVEEVNFVSVKERLHENSRASTSTIDSNKHDKKSFAPEKKEKILEESKSKPVLEKKEKVVEETKSKPVSEKKGKVVEEAKGKPVPEKKEKVSEETKTKPVPSEEREPVLKVHHAKLSLTIRLQKDGPDGAVGIAEIIKKPDDFNIGEEPKRESSKPERNTSSKHDVAETHNGPCKSTRKSARLMNQAASKSTAYDEVSEEVVKKNSKSSNSNVAAHSEPVPTRVTRKLRSSRQSEESLPLPSESSGDITDDKNKNEPVFFIHDNAVKEVLPEPKKSKSNHTAESTSNSDTSAASESHKKDTKKLRNIRISRINKLDSIKESSHSLSTTSSDQEGPKKETASTAEEQFDALQKDLREPKVLKVEVARIAEKDLKKTEKLTETEEDSDSRSSPAILLDPKTGDLTYVFKSLESSETPNTTNNPEIKSSTNTAHDTPSIGPCKTGKTPTNETHNAATVIYESSKIYPPVETPVKTLVQSLRSRPPPVTVQSSITSLICDSSSKLSANDKPVEHVKKLSKKTCSTVPVTAIEKPAVSEVPTINSFPETVSVTNSVSVSATQNHPSIITSHGISSTATGSQSSSEVKKEDVIPMVPKISRTNGYQPQVRAIVTTVVTQTTAEHSASLPSNVQTKCSNLVSTSSVLIGPGLPAVYSSANIPPPVNEHISNKPASLPPPMTSESSNIPHAKEALILSSSPKTPVTTWANSKVSSSRHTEAHSRVCTIQTSSSSIPVSKLENRSSKVAHIANSTQSFPQQSAFSLSGYDVVRPIVVGNKSSMMAEILQNSHLLQQQQEYFGISTSQLQSQGVRPSTPIASSIPLDIAARLPHTPPLTPTPPVTSSSHSLSSSDHIARVSPSLHRLPMQPAMITVPPHASIGMHNNDINAFVRMYSGTAALSPFSTSIHPDIRTAQQEAQARTASCFGYPPPIAGNVPSNNFRQPAGSRHQQSVIDTKSESIIVLEGRAEDKMHSVKPGRSKRDDKNIPPDREEHDSHHIPGHEKMPITPRAQQQYASVHQSSPSLTVPHDRATESPAIFNSYASGQSRSSVDTVQPPHAHQSLPLTFPFHQHEVAGSRQMLGVLPIGSPAPTHSVHIDGRSSNPAHSPNSQIFKKDSGHPQKIPSHNPASDKRINSEHSKKVIHGKMPSRQGSSVSPVPTGMNPACSPLSNNMHLVTNTHSSSAMSNYFMATASDQLSGHRVNSHHRTSPQESNIVGYTPPPAHGMPQSSNIPRPPPNQVTDGAILQRYPLMWQGLLALKNDQAAVQMHFLSGSDRVAHNSLPRLINGEIAPIRISQRMRLDTQQLEGVQRKMLMPEEHCILMALPCGKDHSDLVRQSDNLKNGFINYLSSKHAAGIVNATAPGYTQTTSVIHIFPSCEFIQANLSKITPDILCLVNDISHLVVIIATV